MTIEDKCKDAIKVDRFIVEDIRIYECKRKESCNDKIPSGGVYYCGAELKSEHPGAEQWYDRGNE